MLYAIYEEEGYDAAEIPEKILTHNLYGIELDEKFVDVIVKRYIEHSDGHYDDVYVIRDGQKLKFEEVATFEPESEDADA